MEWNLSADYLHATTLLALYDACTAQLVACDKALEQQYAACKPRWDDPDTLPKIPSVKPNSKRKNQPAFNVRAHLVRLTGVDLVAISGISQSLAQIIIAEVGTDMSKFPTVKSFCSWLGLAPHNHISGGKVLHSHTLKTDNRAGQALRQAAQANTKSQSVTTCLNITQPMTPLAPAIMTSTGTTANFRHSKRKPPNWVSV